MKIVLEKDEVEALLKTSKLIPSNAIVDGIHRGDSTTGRVVVYFTVPGVKSE